MITDRDRRVISIIVPLLLVAGYWFLLLAPKRVASQNVGQQLTKAQSSRDEAEQQVAQLQAAKASFGSDYATVLRLGKAVPTTVDMPSLLVQLDSAANGTGVVIGDFKPGPLSTGNGAGSGGPSGGSTPAGGGNNPAAPGAPPAQGFPAKQARERRERPAGHALVEPQRSGSRVGPTHLHHDRQLLQPGRLLPPAEALRPGGQQPDRGQRAPDDDRELLVPAGRCEEHVAAQGGRQRDDLPDAARPGHHRRGHGPGPLRDPGWSGHASGVRHTGDAVHPDRHRHAMTTFLLDLWQDLRAKRLWPVAVALVVATLAVPLVLSKSASSPVPPTGGGQATGASKLPTVALDASSIDTSHLDVFGQKNPFAANSDKAVTIGAPTGPTTPAGAASKASGTSGTTGSTTSSGTSTSPTRRTCASAGASTSRRTRASASSTCCPTGTTRSSPSWA
ncbi:MAG: hypothetical protein E6G07_04465 [Actinobacteria bacterium]|nr:MAG: hypothetical protein E6G07_04465 [Actinomycetota bacterium]